MKEWKNWRVKTFNTNWSFLIATNLPWIDTFIRHSCTVRNGHESVYPTQSGASLLFFTIQSVELHLCGLCLERVSVCKLALYVYIWFVSWCLLPVMVPQFGDRFLFQLYILQPTNVIIITILFHDWSYNRLTFLIQCLLIWLLKILSHSLFHFHTLQYRLGIYSHSSFLLINYFLFACNHWLFLHNLVFQLFWSLISKAKEFENS